MKGSKKINAFWLAGILEENFLGQSISSGHYPPIYQPPKGVHLLISPQYFSCNKKQVYVWNEGSFHVTTSALIGTGLGEAR